MKIAHFVFSGLMAAMAGGAQAATLDFTGLQEGELPRQFYAGGAGSEGSVGGADRNFGVTFMNAEARCNLGLDCKGPSQEILQFTMEIPFAKGAAPLDFDIDVAGGFVGDMNFKFATTQAGQAELWSGANGGGELLATTDLAAGACPKPGLVCAFSTASLRLADGEVAHSVRFTGVDPNFFAIDDLALNLEDGENAVPEPATWSLMIVGFGLAGAGLRRRRLAST